MLHVVLWKWSQPGFREPYRPEYVNKLVGQLRPQLVGMKSRIILITDNASGVTGVDAVYPLWSDCEDMQNASGPGRLPSCYRRLKLYDPQTQERTLEIRPGERILSLDVDTAVLQSLVPIVEASSKHRFMGWARAGEKHPKVFNGSFQLFSAGDLADIWKDFAADPQGAALEARRMGFAGSDQAWLSMKLVARERCDGLSYPTIASYPLHAPQLRMLSKSVRIVFFHGRVKPWHAQALRQSRWLNRYWS
jgi:hypothetical protein